MNEVIVPRVGALTLHEKVGQGGNGEVWFATHPHHGDVALKLVRPSMPAPAGVEDVGALLTERLFREAELAARVRHPNVVRVLEHGLTADGESYLVSERLRGCDLGAVLTRHGRLSPRVAVAIVDSLLAALEAVHAAGIVHRDLKPDNLVLHVEPAVDPADSAKKFADVQPRTVLKLIDFGIASAAEVAGPKLTRTGTVVGTPHYLAPEQAAGGTLDARTDLYAVGVIFHELLTGRTPFEGLSLQELVAALVLRDVEPITNLRPGVPGPIAALVHRALERDPDARPQSATAFRAELAWAAASSGVLGGDLEGLVIGGMRRTRAHASEASTPPKRPRAPVREPESKPSIEEPRERAPIEEPRERAPIEEPHTPPPVKAPPDDDAPSRATSVALGKRLAAWRRRTSLDAEPPTPVASARSALPSAIRSRSLASTSREVPPTSRLVRFTAPVPLVRRRAPRLDVEPAPLRRGGWSTRAPLALMVMLLAALTVGFAEPDVVVHAPDELACLDVAPLCGGAP
jgi:serine/threonine-protein kinase